MPAGSTYSTIATTTLGSAVTTYTFTSIPSTYTDLVLVASGTLTAGGTAGVLLQLGNGSIDTGANYSATQLDADGGTAATYRETNATELNIGIFNASNSVSIFQLQNYSNATTNKTILARGNSNAYLRTAVGVWRSTNAINQIRLSTAAGRSFTAGSTFTLYGITAA
jgi:hypothetical protein